MTKRVAKRGKVVVWRLDPDLALAYTKILTTVARLVDAKGGRGTAALTRDLVRVVTEARAAGKKAPLNSDYPA